jgi:hypothetical protein
MLDLPPLTSANDEEGSGGETRTLNLTIVSHCTPVGSTAVLEAVR